MGYRVVVLRHAGQYGFVALIGLLVMAWGTSPCLYVNLVRSLAHAEDCCCNCCCDASPDDTNERQSDDCPACQTFGNMHELPPVGEPVTLEAPAETFLPASDPSSIVLTQAPITTIDTDVGLAPPRVAFCETVRLTR